MEIEPSSAASAPMDHGPGMSLKVFISTDQMVVHTIPNVNSARTGTPKDGRSAGTHIIRRPETNLDQGAPMRRADAHARKGTDGPIDDAAPGGLVTAMM
jgi:hypothetical protein